MKGTSILVIEQFEVTPGCATARLHLINEDGATYDWRWDDDGDDGYPDPTRISRDDCLAELIKAYGTIRPLPRALADGWRPFQTEEVPVRRGRWSGKVLDGSPEGSYACRRWWLERETP